MSTKSGKEHITGQSVGDETDDDYATIKYNSSGVQQWVSRYDGPVSSADYATKLKAYGGLVFVSGMSIGSTAAFDFDFATICYDASNGSTFGDWENTGFGVGVRRFAGPSYDWDGANDLVVNYLGLYVAGVSEFDFQSNDPAPYFTVIKYNPGNGNEEWVNNDYSGFGNGVAIFRIIGSGNSPVAYNDIFVTGEGPNGGLTQKYDDDNGSRLSYITYSGAYFSSITTDAYENVYVAGLNGSYDALTVSYLSDLSDQNWECTYTNDASSQLFGIQVDNAGNTYVTGNVSSTTSYHNYLTIKYIPEGDNLFFTTLEPLKFNLSQNFPNPFNPVTRINYSIPNNSYVVISVYNILGELVSTLVNEYKSSGSYELKFDGSNLSSGIYIYTIKSGMNFETKKMLLIK